MLVKNLELAKEAVEYVRSKVIFGSNALKDSKKENWEPTKLLQLRQQVYLYAFIYAHTNNGIADFGFISELTHNMLIKWGFGNSGEQAQTAFHYLKKRGVAPIDYCMTSECEHNLVVIGRSKNSDPKDISTWGKDAVVCDPWAEMIYPLSDFQEMQKIVYNIPFVELVENPKPYLAGQLISEQRVEPVIINKFSMFSNADSEVAASSSEACSFLKPQ